MTPERYRRIRNLYEAVLERQPADRDAFMRDACRDDADLFQEVSRLITIHERTDGFLQMPVVVPEAVADWIPRMEGRRIGAYLVLRELGRGGMGVVYLATRFDGAFSRDVAIKIAGPQLDGEAVMRRFRREREILAALDHPHIARLLDAGSTEEGLPYFVMEYIDGQRIDHWCNERALNVTGRLELFSSVCAALDYAHHRRVVHLDLKPGNILVTGEGTVKLLDFGIAQVLRPDAGASPSVEPATLLNLMTPEYASPEQVRFAPLGVPSDVYSLGVVLYELLTGHRPYRLRTHVLQEVARVICEEEPTRPSTVVMEMESAPDSQMTVTPEAISAVREGDPLSLRKRLEGDLDAILLKALRKEPLARYSSASDLNDDLGRHLGNLPVTALKGSRRYQLQRFLHRHHRALMAIGVLLATLLAGVAATIWQERLALNNTRRDLTLPQLALYTYAALIITPVAAYVSRATSRRLSGALAGAAGFVIVGAAAVRGTASLGWWRFSAPDLLRQTSVVLVGIDAACYATLLSLVSWRVGRRFGWRGRTAFIVIMSLWGAARDYATAAATGLVVIAPGLATFAGWSAAWFCALAVMQATMRLVAGPDTGDRLARAPR